jgi:hypothetical protein
MNAGFCAAARSKANRYMSEPVSRWAASARREMCRDNSFELSQVQICRASSGLSWQPAALPGWASVFGESSVTAAHPPDREAPLTPEFRAIFAANLADQALGREAGDPTCPSPGTPRGMGPCAAGAAAFSADRESETRRPESGFRSNGITLRGKGRSLRAGLLARNVMRLCPCWPTSPA